MCLTGAYCRQRHHVIGFQMLFFAVSCFVFVCKGGYRWTILTIFTFITMPWLRVYKLNRCVLIPS